MAEGLLRHDAGELFEVESAGTKPSFVRPEAITVMEELGVSMRGQPIGQPFLRLIPGQIRNATRQWRNRRQPRVYRN